MPTTKKRVCLALTKQDLCELEKLMAHFEETQTKVIQRALILLHYITFNNETTKKEKK